MLSELQNKKKFPRDFSDFSEFLWLTRFYEKFTIQKQVKTLLTLQQGILKVPKKPYLAKTRKKLIWQSVMSLWSLNYSSNL